MTSHRELSGGDGRPPTESAGAPLRAPSGTVGPDAAHLASPRHVAGFAISGACAFATDAAVLELLIRVAGLGPLVARLAAVATAMVVGWLCHRRLTFAMTGPPRLGEFGRYAAAAWLGAGLNYAVYAGVLLLRPQTPPFAALVVASVIAMLFSYLTMRYGVFRQTDAHR